MLFKKVVIDPIISSYYLYQKAFLSHLLQPHVMGDIYIDSFHFMSFCCTTHSPTGMLHYMCMAGFLTPVAEKQSHDYFYSSMQPLEVNNSSFKACYFE